MKRQIITISLIVLLLDQLIKYVVCNYLTSLVIIPNFISLVYAENTGVAFSMLSGGRALIIFISILLLVFLTYILYKEYICKGKNKFLLNLTYGVLYGGILGNLLDRVIKGVVVDYVSLNIFGYHFPIFNLADVAITIGVILFIAYNIKNEKETK